MTAYDIDMEDLQYKALRTDICKYDGRCLHNHIRNNSVSTNNAIKNLLRAKCAHTYSRKSVSNNRNRHVGVLSRMFCTNNSHGTMLQFLHVIFNVQSRSAHIIIQQQYMHTNHVPHDSVHALVAVGPAFVVQQCQHYVRTRAHDSV